MLTCHYILCVISIMQQPLFLGRNFFFHDYEENNCYDKDEDKRSGCPVIQGALGSADKYSYDP